MIKFSKFRWIKRTSEILCNRVPIDPKLRIGHSLYNVYEEIASHLLD